MAEIDSDLREYLEKKFRGVYARIDDMKEDLQRVNIESIKTKLELDNHCSSTIHHYAPCPSNMRLGRLVWALLITCLISAGGLVAALISKG